jgi:hypothetical protein
MNSITAKAKPSHAPRDHVKIRQQEQRENAEKKRSLSPTFFDERSIAKSNGRMSIRYSPRTFGFSKVDTARPGMLPNISVSCHFCEMSPMKYLANPIDETIMEEYDRHKAQELMRVSERMIFLMIKYIDMKQKNTAIFGTDDTMSTEINPPDIIKRANISTAKSIVSILKERFLRKNLIR